MDEKEKGRRLMERAEAWRRDNPGAWRYIESRALGEAHAHRKFGIKQLVEEARRKDFAAIDGSRTRICNSLTPAFARMLASEHPEVRPFVVLKHSVADGAE